MKKLRTIVFILIAISFSIETFSQNNISIHFGLSSPESDFGKSDVENEKSAGAALGLNVGLQYIYPLAESGFGLIGGIDFNYNGLKEDYRDDSETLSRSMGANFDEINFNKYINVPITLGLRYSYIADDNIGVFANAGLALNFLKITDVEFVNSHQSVKYKFDISSNFGYKVGAGIIIKQKHIVSINYMALGIHDIDGEVSSGISSEIDLEMKVDLLNITYGIMF